MLSVRRHGPLLLLLVGILLVLVGCRSEPPARIVGFPQYEGTVKSGGLTWFGKLIVAGGCLRVTYPSSNNPQSSALVVWPSNFTLSVKGNSVQIIDGAGLIAARVGDDVSYSGYGTKDIGNIALQQPLPAGCPGPYRIVGDRFRAVGSDEPTVVSIPGSTLFFPRQKSIRTAGGVLMDALKGGELILDGDCLRVGALPYRNRKNNPNPTVVWPAGFTPHIEDGVVHIRDGAGRTIARVGDEIYMGGGGAGINHKVTDSARCPGKYWIAHNVRHPSKFEVIVENRSEDAVVVYVSGRRLGSKDEDEIIEGCSTKRFGPKSWFAPKPTRDLRVSVYDSHGVDRRQILETRVSPKFPEDSSDVWYVEVVVPGAADDECQ